MPDLGTVTLTEEIFNSIKKIKFDWISVSGGGDAGKATKTTTGVYTGEIIRLVTDPGAAPNAPSDNYNVLVNDEDGNDVLMGAGAARDEANTEQILASSLGCVANDKLSLSINSAGNAKQGSVILYIRP